MILLPGGEQNNLAMFSPLACRRLFDKLQLSDLYICGISPHSNFAIWLMSPSRPNIGFFGARNAYRREELSHSSAAECPIAECTPKDKSEVLKGL